MSKIVESSQTNRNRQIKFEDTESLRAAIFGVAGQKPVKPAPNSLTFNLASEQAIVSWTEMVPVERKKIMDAIAKLADIEIHESASRIQLSLVGDKGSLSWTETEVVEPPKPEPVPAPAPTPNPAVPAAKGAVAPDTGQQKPKPNTPAKKA